jgi:hypothetical protein
VTHGTFEHIKTSTSASGSKAAPYVNTYLRQEEVTVSVTAGGACTGQTFKLSFSGHTTDAVDCNVSEGDLTTALEKLGSVSQVTVSKVINAANPLNVDWVITFEPNSHPQTQASMKNFGDLPAFSHVDKHNDLTIGFSAVSGSSPFKAEISYAALSAIHTTAVDQASVRYYEGLSTGVFEHDTYFTIEARDEFSNRIE